MHQSHDTHPFDFEDVPCNAPQETLSRPMHGVGVELKGIIKSFASHRVLQGVDLQLHAGEFVAVVGRSGCGKSTLLRTIAQLEVADAGSVHIGNAGENCNIRIMFQEPRLLPWKTVLDNVAIGMRSVPSAAAALAKVGLGERAGDWPTELSGGQRQRVALARALVHEPQLLLLDEPLGALDALTRIEMQHLIETLWRERGFTAVLITHDVQEALALADRVLLVEEGRIVLDFPVPLCRPRRRGDAAFAAFEQYLLSRLLGEQPE